MRIAEALFLPLKDHTETPFAPPIERDGRMISNVLPARKDDLVPREPPVLQIQLVKVIIAGI